MANLIALKDRFDVAFGNDDDNDRHRIVTRCRLDESKPLPGRLRLPTFFANRPGWKPDAGIGRTLVSGQLDRPRRGQAETEVALKSWASSGLSVACSTGSLGIGGEESAGASFLRRDGAVWSTDKDGIVVDLLAAEMIAKPAAIHRSCTRCHRK